MDADNKPGTLSSTQTLERGSYRPAGPSDLRSPCPMINCLANHGYLPRNGRNMYRKDVYAAMRFVGLSSVLAAFFSDPIFLERKDGPNASSSHRSLLSKLWYYLRNPLAIVLSKFGMRLHGQTDKTGKPYLNLDEVALHNAVEHDVSLTRRDFYQGDNCSPQKDLVKLLLAASTDGGHNLSMEDLAKLRVHRIETQKLENKELDYGALQHELGCGEIALILKVLGDGKKVPRSFLEAFFAEERLPIKEGWKKRKWWPLGLVELKITTNKVKSLIGSKF